MWFWIVADFQGVSITDRRKERESVEEREWREREKEKKKGAPWNGWECG